MQGNQGFNRKWGNSPSPMIFNAFLDDRPTDFVPQ